MKKNITLILLILSLSACSSDETYKDDYILLYKNENVEVYIYENPDIHMLFQIDYNIYEDEFHVYSLYESTVGQIIVLFEEEEYRINQALDNGWLTIEEIIDLNFNDDKIVASDK